MFRKPYGVALLLAMIFVAASAVNADINTPNVVHTNSIEISLTIPGYTSVTWPAPGDPTPDPSQPVDGSHETITFNDTVQDGTNHGDWYNDELEGQYGSAPAASTDPGAEGYYESYDQAEFWLESNVNSTMTLTSGGNLTNGSAELPTWYTVAFQNQAHYPSDSGFIDGGIHHFDGQIPGYPAAAYGADDDGDHVIEKFPGPGRFWPDQYAFPMVEGGSPTVYTANFTAYTEGRIIFHARTLRSAESDPAGAYTTDLTVEIATP